MAIQIAVVVGETVPLEITARQEPWQERFAACAGLIRGAMGPCAARIEHIGSTAVPGLPGRPQLDVQVAVAEPEAEEDYRGALESLGFRLRVREADRRVFEAAAGALPAPGPGCETHVHVCRSGGVVEYDRLLMVGYLAGHPERRDQYAALKQRFAGRRRSDAEAYAQAKGVFLRETVRLAHRAYIDLRTASGFC